MSSPVPLDPTSAVALPPRVPSSGVAPVWKLEEGKIDPVACEEKERDVCCKDLRDPASERHLIDPDVVRDLVIGLADGLTVPFALTAGLSGLGSTHFVVTAGVAELISGAISMGIGGFLAAQADRTQYLFLEKATRERVARSCLSELARETHEVLAPMGIDERTSALVAASLSRVEGEARSTLVDEKHARFSMNFMTERVGDTPGLTQFLLSVGEGMQETTRLRMILSGATVGLGYLLGGIVPMIPYFIVKGDVLTALWWSIGVTAFALLVFGGGKAYYTGAKNGTLGVMYGAVSTLALGGGAAAASYGVVKALQNQ